MLHFYIVWRQTVIDNYGTDQQSVPDITFSAVCDRRTGRYEVDDYENYIRDDIYKKLSDFIDPAYKSSDISFILSSPSDDYELMVDKKLSDIKDIEIHVDNDNRVYGYTKISSFYINVIYSVISIDSDDLGFLVSEYIKTDDINNPVITKCYHSLFSGDELSDARKYCEFETKESARMGYDIPGEFKIMPVSVSDMSESSWYQMNIDASNIMKRYGISRNEYRMISDLNFMAERLKADSYHSLSFDDKFEIDYMLCSKLVNYVDDDLVESVCGGDISQIDPYDMYDIVNMFMISALGDAESEEKFYEIKDAMGAYVGRINDLNEQARYHKNEGYVLVSRTGEIKWYSDCYAINEWHEARGNAYYHKFQPNTTALVCFVEYRPELFVDSFPDPSLIQKYDADYKQSLLDVRRMHSEFRFRNYPQDDMLMAMGTWFPNGVESENRVDDARFFAFYYEYNFNYEQSKVLLNGEEVVINDYKSENTGDIITIKGRLREATRFTQYANCEFYRSDQEQSSRNSILMSIGANEPENPYA